MYSDRKESLEYLKKYIYEDALIKKYISDNDPDDDLLLLFNNEFPTDGFITDALICRNKQSGIENKYLASLIKRNSEYALQRYIDMCRDNNRIPEDFSEHKIPQITESLRYINDINLLDLLTELIIVRYTEDFVDADVFGLSSSLNVALQNVAKTDYIKVKSALNELMQTHDDNIELKTFCEYLIINQDIEIGLKYEKPLDESIINDMIK